MRDARRLDSHDLLRQKVLDGEPKSVMNETKGPTFHLDEQPAGEFIEFEVNDPQRFNLLRAVFSELKKDKDADDFRPDEAWPQLFDDKALAQFSWHSPEDLQRRMYDLRHRPTLETPTESTVGQQWDFVSMVDSYKNSECELKRCAMVGEGKGRLEFNALAYPYGGVGWMVALIEAFGFKVTGIEDGTGFVQFN